MTRDDMIYYINTGYNSNISKVLEEENIDNDILLMIVDNARTEEILLKVLNKNIDSDIFEAVFKRNKAIQSSNVTIKIIEERRFFTKEMYEFYTKNSYHKSVIEKLILSPYATEESYIKILESNSSKKNIEDYINTMVKGPAFSESVLEKIIDLNPENDDLVVECINNPFINENILVKIVQLVFSDTSKYPNSIKQILESKSISKDMLIKMVDSLDKKIDKYIDQILNNPNCDSSVVEKIKCSSQDIFDKLIQSQYLNEQILINCIPMSLYIENLRKLINSSQMTENVYIKLVDCIETNRDLSNPDKRVFMNEILIKDNITDKVLSKILTGAFVNDTIVSIAKNHPKASIKTKVDLLINQFSVSNEEIENVFSSNDLELEDVHRLVNKHANAVSYALDYPLADDELYCELAKKIILYLPNEDFNKLLEKDISEKVLICFIDKNIDKAYIDKVVEHPNAGFKVANKLSNLADELTPTSGTNDLAKYYQHLSNELRFKVISREYAIEEEKNVTEQLRQNVEDGLSTMLWGPSGVGKSARVFQIDPTATTLILKNGMLPEEVIGGKEANGEPGEKYPPHWYTVLTKKCSDEPDRQHILFIDEITNVSDTIKNLVWEIVGMRMVNGNEYWPLPDNCSIVVAGNRLEESSAVRMDRTGGVMPAPLHNRIDSMIEVEFDIQEWAEWALKKDTITGKTKIHPLVFAFCYVNASDVMFTPYDSEKPEQVFLTPRKWEGVSKAIYKSEERAKRNNEIGRPSINRLKTMIGVPEIADAFISFLLRLPLDMNKISNGEYSSDDFENIEDKYYALSTVISDYNGDEVALEAFIVECLGEEFYAIYQNIKNEYEETNNKTKVLSI